MIDAPTFTCAVVHVHDSDGPYWCAHGPKIRIAGINARETDGTCKANAPCPTMRHEQAQPIAARLVLHKRLTCRQVGTSYKRIVASCSILTGNQVKAGKLDLGCELVRLGAAVEWPSFRRRYSLGRCSDG